MSESGGLINQITSDATQKTGLQFAFYNALLFVVTGICLAGLYSVYRVMYMFLNPLLWAMLVGTILFPLKRRFNQGVSDWLTRLDKNDTPLVVGLILLPFEKIYALADLLLYYAMRREGIAALAAFVVLKILSFVSFIRIIGFVGNIYEHIDSIILGFTRKGMLPVIILYFAAYAGWIYVQDSATINKKVARALSLPLWIFALSFMSSLCGPLRVIVFVTAAVVLALIAAGRIFLDDSEAAAASSGASGSASKESALSEKSATDQTDLSQVTRLDKALTGDFYIQAIFGLCLLLFAVRHDWLFVCSVFLVVLAIVIKTAEALGIFTAVSNSAVYTWSVICEKLDLLVHIIVAGSLRKFVTFLFTSDRMLRNSFRNSLDVLSSVLVMAFLAFGSIFVIVFVGFQLHNETVHLIKLGGNVLTHQPDWLGAARNYTEDQLAQHDIDDYVEQAYQKGRAWLASNVRSLVDPKDKARADALEQQVMQLVDNIYGMWEERNVLKMPTDDSKALTKGDWITQLKGAADIVAFKEEIMKILKQNLETILSVVQSMWSVIMLNVSFLGSVLTAITSVIIGFGLDILNFFIEFIVFLTAVYYLLASSKDRWLPLKLISDAIPAFSFSVGDSPPTLKTEDLTTAIEASISGVFVLTSKMAVFYGLYTYFVHALFDLNIIFVPSMLAGIFAAVPIMAPYFVCAIGVVELYLVRSETAAAIMFVLASAAPITFADAAFYRQLKGSHPYVTGLSIVGGMYWLGLQGAIFGPILLCCMIVLWKVYAKFAKS